MIPNNTFHIIHLGKTWRVKKQGSIRATAVFLNKGEAVIYAQLYAPGKIIREALLVQNKVIIHNPDGTVDMILDPFAEILKQITHDNLS